jgi:hypothetical protein
MLASAERNPRFEKKKILHSPHKQQQQQDIWKYGHAAKTPTTRGDPILQTNKYKNNFGVKVSKMYVSEKKQKKTKRNVMIPGER